MSDRTPDQAYTALQRLAREQGRTTQQLFELYVHECFLARLAQSAFADRLVLKGGMLLAALGARRATRDVDMLARGIDSDVEHLHAMVREIALIDMRDGVEFDVGAISSQPIREAADYQGVRVSVPARIGGARLLLRLDLSFGDPVQAQVLAYPTLLDDPEVTLLGYPVEAVIAEKVESMIFLGDANTRDRDYADVYRLAQLHELRADRLRLALAAVVEHRGHEALALGPRLQTLRQTRQQPWAAFRDRAGLPDLPESFADVVDVVVALVDGLPEDEAEVWDSSGETWR